MIRGHRGRRLLRGELLSVVLLVCLTISPGAIEGTRTTAATQSSSSLQPIDADQPIVADGEWILPLDPPEEATPTPLPAAETTPTPEPTSTIRAALSPRVVMPPPGSMRVPILMYHYIRVNPDPSDKLGFALSITPQDFQRQVAYLADQGYHSVTLEQLAAALNGELQLPSKPVVLTFDDGYRDFFTDAFPVLRRYRLTSTAFVITGLVGQPRYLTWQMIDELSQSGLVEFGSHTVSHADLSKLPLNLALAEIQESKRVLEGHLTSPVRLFCYPSGKYTREVANLVKDVGYEVAVTTSPGANHVASDLLTLKRVRVDGRDSFAGFVEKLRTP